MASSNLLECSVCHKFFSTKGNLNKHSKKHAETIGPSQEFNFEEALFKCFEGCQLSFKTNTALRQHLALKHDFEIVQNHLEFATLEEYQIWVETEEKNNNVRFYKPRGSKRNVYGDFEKFTLMCSRSGKQRVVCEDLRKRNEKCQGSSKYNFGCTSQIIVTKEIPSNKHSIIYFSTHYGHGEEIKHLRISKMCRKEVAQKLLLAVSSTRLLDSSRDNIKEVLNRDDILTRKDINNIKTSFNININEGCRHHDDATSVRLWVKECRSYSFNPVLFFKQQGEVTSEWDLHVNDFCLIFMNITQVEIFKNFGSNIVCVDGTHGMNAYDFELTTVLVLDEFGEGFPVGFLFSNRKDSHIYEFFFHHLKKAYLSEIQAEYSCNVFMSDVTNVYFNAWATVMGPVKKQLYCSWHIDRAWQQNLTKVQDRDKRNWVYKTLKYLQTCLDENVFEKEFEAFLSLLQRDEETKNMYDYLLHHYYDNRFQWAYCFRKACGINTNMHLESMHKTLKYVYLEGKNIKRLDKSIYALQKYLRDKTIDRVIKLTKGKCTEHINKINNRHRVALIKPYGYTVKEENIFEINDDTGNAKYIVIKTAESICCALVCKYCNICVHTFECSCPDYSIRATICKHIHSVNMSISPALRNHTIIEEGNSNNNEIEVNHLVKNLATSTSKKSSETLVDEIKLELSKLQNNLNTLKYTPEEHEHIYKHLKNLNNLGSTALLSSQPIFLPNDTSLLPANKKIEKQKFFSTKKKRPQKKCITKPNSKEQKIIKETLNQSLIISNVAENDHLYYK